MTTTAAATTKTKKRKARITTFDVVVYFILIALMILMLYPLLFVVSASFSDPKMVAAGKMLLLPVEPNLDGYKYIFQYKEIWTGYLNTIFYTFFGTVLNLAATMPCAYALSRKDLRGRGIIMIFFMIPMYFSGGMIPGYLNVKSLGLLDTRAMILVNGLVSTYNLIVCRTYFQTAIPYELQEAAVIDGCDDFQIFTKIIFPLAKPITVVMALYYGVGRWNSYFVEMILSERPRQVPITAVPSGNSDKEYLCKAGNDKWTELFRRRNDGSDQTGRYRQHDQIWSNRDLHFADDDDLSFPSEIF